jgi:alpha-ribazole phosphatase
MALLDLIRHGETDAPGRLMGRTECALSQKGWSQFERQTADRAFTRIVASPLKRARAAAERLAQARGLTVAIDPDWAEMDFGVWDGSPLKDLHTQHAGMAEIYQRGDAPAAHGGESWMDLTRRVGKGLRVLAEESGTSPVLIVTHGGPIRAALSIACDIPFERLWVFKIDYGTRVTLRIGLDDGGRLWGEIVEVAQA